MARQCVRCGNSKSYCTCQESRNRSVKCLQCRKYTCICVSTQMTKPVNSNAYPKGTRVDSKGIYWCGCGCRVINYQCTNVRCSTYQR